MHWIQYHILLELTRHGRRRHSELRPDGVEGNLFQYHLERLIKDKLVEKVDGGYGLSTKGRQLAGTLSLQMGRPRVQPKILTAVICRDDSGRYLMVRWKREPNMGQVSFPHGMMHFGRTVSEMTGVELAEKAGLEAEGFVYIGEVVVRGFLDGEVDRHMIVHLMEARNVRPNRQNELRPEVSEALWARLEDIDSQEFVPGFYEIAKLLANRNKADTPVFAELDVVIPKTV